MAARGCQDKTAHDLPKTCHADREAEPYRAAMERGSRDRSRGIPVLKAALPNCWPQFRGGLPFRSSLSAAVPVDSAVARRLWRDAEIPMEQCRNGP